jgi:hypothetical protein
MYRGLQQRTIRKPLFYAGFDGASGMGAHTVGQWAWASYGCELLIHATWFDLRHVGHGIGGSCDGPFVYRRWLRADGGDGKRWPLIVGGGGGTKHEHARVGSALGLLGAF